MSKILKISIFSISVLTSLMLSPQAEAKIPIRAFKNVTRHYKESHKSLTFGRAALMSGYIYDLRLYGPFKTHFKDGKREYIKDKGLDNMAKLAKAILPSPTGALNVETTGEYNFGHYADHKAVASLHNFLHKVRKNGEFNNAKIKAISEEITKALPEAKDLDPDKLSGLQHSVFDILKSIQGAVQDEATGLYPKYTTELLINSFFCEKFSTQSDIWALMRELDDEIVDKQNLPKEGDPEDLWKEDDLEAIANKTDPFDADDIFALENADIYHMVTPYKPGETLISNGNTRPYDRNPDDRRTGQYDLKAHVFADCAEMALRHLMNFALFNPEIQEYDLTYVKKDIEADNPFFKNFEEFYEKQTPLLSNAGDIDTRSLWAKVLTDLNTETDPLKIQYVMKGTYELEPGYINEIRALQKVFGLTFKELPTDAKLEDKKQWLSESLTTLFTTLNPTKDYQFDLSTLKEDQGDLSGDLKVSVRDKFGNFFSFTWHAAVRQHSEIKEFKTTETKKERDFTQDIANHTSLVHKGTAEDILWLLTPGIKQPTGAWYELFNTHLTDNNARIKTLETISQRYDQLSSNPKFAKMLPTILKNILDDMSWEDAPILEKVSSVVLDLMKIESLQPTVTGATKGFLLQNVDDLAEPHLNSLFQNMTTLTVSPSITTLKGFEIFKSLKNLILDRSSIKELPDIQIVTNLENLSLSLTQNLEAISLENLNQLKTLNLQRSAVKTLKLKMLTSLENLNLRDTTNLEEITLENLNQLKSLKMYYDSRVKAMTLNTLTSLESLDLYGARYLKEISLENLNQLKTLNLQRSAVKTLKLKMLTSLENLDLWNTTNLEEITLENLEQLKTLNMHSSSVKAMTLNTLTSLESLDLQGTRNLTELSLENMPQLKKINLSHSKIKTITGVNTLTSLEDLNLGPDTNLEEIAFENMTQLKVLGLYGSNAKTIPGLNMLTSLESLDLSRTENLVEISFENMTQLKKINLSFSKIKTITELNTLANLETLDLTYTRNLEEISLENLTLLKTLNLNGSTIKTITGLSTLTSLKTLDLSGSVVKTLPELNTLTSLETLNLSRTNNLEEIALENLILLKNLHLGGQGLKAITGLNTLTSLENLEISSAYRLKYISLENLTQLKKFTLEYSGIENVIGLNTLTNLEELSLSGSDISEVSLENLTQLKTLNMDSSDVKTLTELYRLTNLETLSLSNTRNLKEIFVENLIQLKTLNLVGSGVKTITGLKTLTSLETLDLSHTQNLKDIFLENLNLLKSFNLEDSAVKNLKFKNNNLLENISLKNLNHIMSLKLDDSYVKTLKLNTLTKLEYLYLEGTQNLEEISLEDLNQLKIIDLRSSAVKNITGLNTLIGLENLDLSHTQNLEEISFENMTHLKKIDLDYSGIQSITGLNTLTNLEDLSLRGLHFPEIELENMTKLKTLDLAGSGVENLTGLNTLTNLEELDLSDATSLKYLEFDQPMPNLKIDLRGSGITNRYDIRGFEFLDERKITW